MAQSHKSEAHNHTALMHTVRLGAENISVELNDVGHLDVPVSCARRLLVADLDPKRPEVLKDTTLSQIRTNVDGLLALLRLLPRIDHHRSAP